MLKLVAVLKPEAAAEIAITPEGGGVNGAGPAPLWTGSGLQGGAIVLLAVLVSLFALHWASAVVVPVLLGLTFSYALTPVVNQMVRWRLPRAVASTLLLLAIIGSFGSVVWALSGDAVAMMESLPDVAQKLRREVARQRDLGAGAVLVKVQKAAAEIESVAGDAARPAGPAPSRVTRVQLEPLRFDVRDHLWTGTQGLISGLAHVTVVLFVALFMLSSGDTFRRKMARIAGPNFGMRRLTVSALDEIDQQIQRYLLVQLFTSLLVGVAVWLCFWGLGLENAPVWGLLAFVLNFIPYLGSVVLTGASSLFAFMQFGSIEMALVVGGVSLLINSVESHVLTPWLTVRSSRMNPVAVFVGVLAWGWLWGLGGLFLGMPILIAVKAVCDRVNELKAVGEILGD